MNTGQNYFFSIIKPQDRLNFGVIHFLSYGLAGGLGSLLGGSILQWLQSMQNFNELMIFRIYFGCIAAVFIIILFLITLMESQGAYGIKNAFAVIFSPRDLRAISLLNRLGKTKSLSEEKEMIRALADSKSGLSVQDIILKLRSPRFSVRSEALSALSNLPLNKKAVDALLWEVKNHSFTTAYMAADIIGKRNVREGIKLLRKNINSNDYFLSGKCIVSLARLNDRESIPVIEDIITRTKNPRLIIHGAWALEIYKNPGSLPVLLSKLEEKTSPFLRDEIILSISGILDIDEWFYPLYVSFLEKSTEGISLLRDEINKYAKHKINKDEIDIIDTIDEILELINKLPRRNRSAFSHDVENLLARCNVVRKKTNISSILQTAAADPHLIRLDRFAFLLASYIVRLTCGKEKFQ